jgi:hypothetical protein
MHLPVVLFLTALITSVSAHEVPNRAAAEDLVETRDSHLFARACSSNGCKCVSGLKQGVY